MSSKQFIWECKTSDGVRTYFENEPEADFFRKDCVQAGFNVLTQTISVPQTAKEFASFMESQELVHREMMLAAKKLAES